MVSGSGFNICYYRCLSYHTTRPSLLFFHCPLHKKERKKKRAPKKRNPLTTRVNNLVFPPSRPEAHAITHQNRNIPLFVCEEKKNANGRLHAAAGFYDWAPAARATMLRLRLPPSLPEIQHSHNNKHPWREGKIRGVVARLQPYEPSEITRPAGLGCDGGEEGCAAARHGVPWKPKGSKQYLLMFGRGVGTGKRTFVCRFARTRGGVVCEGVGSDMWASLARGRHSHRRPIVESSPAIVVTPPDRPRSV